MKKEDFVKRMGLGIRNLREEKSLSLEQLAFNAGIEYSQLSRIENGKINTSIYSTYNIAKALGISMSELFFIVQ